MKHFLITTIAAVVLVGCAVSQQSAPALKSKPVEPVAEVPQPEPPTAKAPDISIYDAAIDGNIEAVKLLIANGADVNAKDSIGSTPLHNATRNGHKEIVELLIAKGADVNTKDLFGGTPLDIAMVFDYTEIADLLRKSEPPTGKTPDDSLWEAAMFGEIEAAKKAIADGANVNAKKDDGETPLHWATVESMDSGSKKVIELLISKGADVNAKILTGRKKGMTPLAIAKMFSNKKIIALLRKHGGKTSEELKAEGK